MFIFRNISELQEFVARNIDNHRSIGLVPTMGALHKGHLSLVKKAVADNDVTVVSVFVNPTQFNNPDDLASYPRDEEADFALLAKENVDAVFAPTPEDMYPEGMEKAADHVFDLGHAAEVMEGLYRPGHFQGVAQVVSRLLRYCRPTRAYFGEKDFQQIAVIRNMVESEHIDVDIVACPICRADDGLALSSRNALLTPEQRRLAPEIYSTLRYSVEYSKDHSIDATHRTVVERLDSFPGMKVEYFEIVDARSLAPVVDWDQTPDIVGCITVYNGKVRLIDNICYRRGGVAPEY